MFVYSYNFNLTTVEKEILLQNLQHSRRKSTIRTGGWFSVDGWTIEWAGSWVGWLSRWFSVYIDGQLSGWLIQWALIMYKILLCGILYGKSFAHPHLRGGLSIQVNDRQASLYVPINDHNVLARMHVLCMLAWMGQFKCSSTAQLIILLVGKTTF